MLIRTSSRFRKVFKRLSKHIRDKAKEKENIFRINPFDSRLDTHKLHGKYKEYWAFTVDSQFRIMFIFAESDIIDFIDIGTHEIYK
ncbi:MAG: type II toxin-antitoxin system mRNA interferase toxin, RelE/StbE family [Patescibacteria group bacterium]